MASCKPARSAFPPTDSHWLSPHRRAFLESLAAQGYAVRTVKSFRLMVGRLCAEAETRGLVPNTLDANVMRETRRRMPEDGHVVHGARTRHGDASASLPTSFMSG